jgi:ligand-binding sensor domain-containing protein
MRSHPSIPGVVFAAASGAVLVSRDYGTTWNSLPLPTSATILDLAIEDETLYAATDRGLFRYRFTRLRTVASPSSVLPLVTRARP